MIELYGVLLAKKFFGLIYNLNDGIIKIGMQHQNTKNFATKL